MDVFRSAFWANCFVEYPHQSRDTLATNATPTVAIVNVAELTCREDEFGVRHACFTGD